MLIRAENLNIRFFSRMKRVPFPSSGETCGSDPDRQSKMIKEKTPGVKTYSTTDNSLDTALPPTVSGNRRPKVWTSLERKPASQQAFIVKIHQVVLVLGYMLWLHRQTSQRLFKGTEKPHGNSPAGSLNSTSWSLEPRRSKQSFLHRWLSASSSSVPQPVTPKSIFS